ncbi:putative polygalacturonase isoform X1 [Senna tora]|uniref:Putative polygalacturonase isoform X1 n=1 Tax=Senna tora TaxID=362788 RepID=A0A834T495_9FABA|nr:putative polygalacturonase isoform X1 [Senna tora]
MPEGKEPDGSIEVQFHSDEVHLLEACLPSNDSSTSEESKSIGIWTLKWIWSYYRALRLWRDLVALLLLLLALSNAVSINGGESGGQCSFNPTLDPRPHSVSILEFGAVGDGKTLNTLAFQNAIFYLKSFADKGGAQLYVPPGKWLTGSFNLTSHLTLFLEKGAVIIGSQDPSNWEVIEPLPSYGRGLEVPGGRYQSLINGYKLLDVVVTGNNGTIDGMGMVWWEKFSSHSLNYSRPHLVEIVESENVLVSNLTLLNAPAFSIHPVYCSNVTIQNISISVPPDSPYTVGIVPDSSNNVCIENSIIATGYDAIALQSGWDEYGIAYGRPTKNVHIRWVHLKASSGSAIAFGSDMSGGISDVFVERVHLFNSHSGIEFRTTRGRGGYIRKIFISNVEMENIYKAFVATGHCGSHPDDKFDPNALPHLDHITFQNVTGSNITIAGNFTGILESPFTNICLSNITLSMNPVSPISWECSDVSGFSSSVLPEPCAKLDSSWNSSSSCFSLISSIKGKSNIASM